MANTAEKEQQRLAYCCVGMKDELHEWRSLLTIDMAKKLCRSSKIEKYSVAILASGGLLDTLAAVRAGLMPIWASEIDRKQQQMWKDLVGTECYGDAFKLDCGSLRRPMILKSGFPCPDYCRLGSRKGGRGETGMLYVQQADLILKIQPMVAILEQTANAIDINNGTEVKSLMDQLSQMYTIHYKIVQVWRHGDPSNRQRLFIIAIHNSLGPRAKQFNFPQGIYDSRRYPTAMDIAEPDEKIPSEYIREERPIERYNWQEPTPGKIHHLGNFGPGAGDSSSPHPLQSWYGLCNTQLTTNGGARRVMMDWKEGDEIEYTRLTIPMETIRIASLSDTYLTWIKKFSKSDEFMRKCVNNGVPLRTSSAIDECVIKFLDDSKLLQEPCG